MARQRNRSRKHSVPSTETPQEAAVENEEQQVDNETPEEVTAPEEPSVVDTARIEYDLPEAWTDADVEWWLSEGNVNQVRTESGNFVADPTRPNRVPSDWSTEELNDYLAGYLTHVRPMRMDELITELRRRVPVERAWSNRELVTYIREGIEPPKTTSGAWVNDITRATRDASEWSKEELEGWAAGEIEAKGKATPAKLTKELRNQVYIPGVYDDSADSVTTAYRRHVVEGVDPTVKTTPDGDLKKMRLDYIEETLDKYIAAVKPGKAISDAEGGAAQRQLDALLTYILRMEGQELAAGLNTFKKGVVREKDGVFSPSNAHRFTHLLKGDRAKRELHVNLIELFVIVGTKPRAARRQVDFRHMLKNVRPDVQDRLVDYFKNYA